MTVALHQLLKDHPSIITFINGVFNLEASDNKSQLCMGCELYLLILWKLQAQSRSIGQYFNIKKLQLFLLLLGDQKYKSCSHYTHIR